MDSRIARLVGDFTPSIESFEAVATRHLTDLFGCDAAHFATIGPRFVASSPPYFQRILADPQRFDPGQQKAREIVARVGPAFIDTEVYSPTERDRLPIFRELLRPARITSVVLAVVEVGGRSTGMLHLIRGGRPFQGHALDEARPLLRAIAILHQALVGMPAVTPAASPEAADALQILSVREHEVATLAAGGHGALQIAHRLGTSVHTVRRQMESIYRKCGIGNRAELASLIQRAALAPEVSRARSGGAQIHRNLKRILASGDLRPAVHAESWRALG